MIIKGKRVIIQDDRDSDPEDYFRWFNLEEWQYYDQPDKPFQPIGREQFDKRAKKNRESFDERKEKKNRPNPGYHIDTVDGQHLGWVSIYNWDQEEKSTFIGINIPEEENWGKGYGTEAVSLFLNFLFDSFDLNTIRTATWTGNKRMVRCAQKAGFANEKIMPHRSSISVRGEPLERIEFSFSRAEWFKKINGG
ncbi:MAG: GNAT family N-acetyltransferase [Chloroflexota bacterium]|nr:GNAT family N-acetyltransferase [Chloroflexota bacterium]